MRLSPSPRIKAYRVAAGLGAASEMGPKSSLETSRQRSLLAALDRTLLTFVSHQTQRERSTPLRSPKPINYPDIPFSPGQIPPQHRDRILHSQENQRQVNHTPCK